MLWLKCNGATQRRRPLYGELQNFLSPNRPVVAAMTVLLTTRLVLALISGQVKSHELSPRDCHHCDVFSELCCQGLSGGDEPHDGVPLIILLTLRTNQCSF